MIRASCFSLILFLTLSGIKAQWTEKCVTGKYPPSTKKHVPSYIVNLDLPPEERWTQVVGKKTGELKAVLTAFKSFIKDFGKGSKVLIRLIDEDLGYVADMLPMPYRNELKGISKVSGIPLGEVVLFNIFYEVFTFCTSIIAADPAGKLYHARNLDFGVFLGWDIHNHTWPIAEALRPAVVNLDFQRGGATLFRATNFAGYVGIITAIKPKMFTLTLNERFNIDGGYIGLIEWILGMSGGAKWMGFLTRETLEHAASFKQAQKMLSNTPMLAPAYFILGGNKTTEACIITRSRDATIDTWNMDSKQPNWYILETNYDHWTDPPFYNDRRTPANKCMQKLSQKNVSFAGLFDVLSTRPVLNKLTVYTSLMQVDSGHLEAWLQYCPDPCPPW